MTDTNNPLIILIGGAAGTGKTSLARRLCAELHITHRLGSGFIREIAKSFVSMEQNTYLYNYSFRPHINIPPFENLYKQSEVIKSPIEACIKRAHDEGTSLVIEGVNVIPGLIDAELVTLFVVLTVENYNEHFKMIQGRAHLQRKIGVEDFEKVRLIQEEFKRAAEEKGYPILDLCAERNSVIDYIKKLIR